MLSRPQAAAATEMRDVTLAAASSSPCSSSRTRSGMCWRMITVGTMPSSNLSPVSSTSRRGTRTHAMVMTAGEVRRLPHESQLRRQQ